jgi:hypothetical protein
MHDSPGDDLRPSSIRIRLVPRLSQVVSTHMPGWPGKRARLQEVSP